MKWNEIFFFTFRLQETFFLFLTTNRRWDKNNTPGNKRQVNVIFFLLSLKKKVEYGEVPFCESDISMPVIILCPLPKKKRKKFVIDTDCCKCGDLESTYIVVCVCVFFLTPGDYWRMVFEYIIEGIFPTEQLYLHSIKMKHCFDFIFCFHFLLYCTVDQWKYLPDMANSYK